MVGNVGQLVESMNAANNAKLQQASSGANANRDNFSDYLDTLLLNSGSGLFSGVSGYSSLNSTSGSIWQMVALQSLRDSLKKEKQSEDGEDSESGKNGAVLKESQAKKTEWAKIRVVERYQSPAKDVKESAKGILV